MLDRINRIECAKVQVNLVVSGMSENSRRIIEVGLSMEQQYLCLPFTCCGDWAGPGVNSESTNAWL